MLTTLADGHDLSPELRALAESGRPGVDSAFIRSLAHTPVHADRFFPFYYDLWFDNQLGPRLSELVRLAIANTTGCPLCLAGRIPEATAAGVTEDDIAQVTTAETGPFSERERAALRYAYLFGSDHHAIGQDAFEALHAHFNGQEIAELAMLCALWLGFGRMVKVFELVEPACTIASVNGAEPHALR
jgi:AhpD family alkylhydroperoxidase